MSLKLDSVRSTVAPAAQEQEHNTTTTLSLPLSIQAATVQPGLIIVYPAEYYQEEAECQGNMEQLFKRRRRGSSIATTDVCYSSKTNRYYEIGSLIQKTLHGSIHHSVTLQPAANARVNALLPSFTRLTSQQFAIKVYKKKDFQATSLNLQTQENPYQEMAILQYLAEKEHAIQGVGKLVEVLEDEQNLYNVLQFEEGEEVFELLAKQGAFSEENTKKIMFQLLQSVSLLHAENIVHRDLSVENLILDEASGRVVVVDFGLSLQLTSSSVPVRNMQVGKVDYMAPEVIQGFHYYDAKQADMWALGVVMLFLLLGFPPLEQATMADVRYEYIVTGRLREMLLGWGLTEDLISDSCVDVVMSMLREHGEDRATAEALLSHPFFASCQQEPSSAQLVAKAAVVECASPTTVIDFEQLSFLCNKAQTSSSAAIVLPQHEEEASYDFYYI